MRRPSDLAIKEVAEVDHLSELVAEYQRVHGRPPVELSYWDPSRSVLLRIGPNLKTPPLGEPFRYRYSYQSDVRERVFAKIDWAAEGRRILITENGTNAVLATANALKVAGVTKVCLLSPRYFATSYALSQLGLRVRVLYWNRTAGRFESPEVRLESGEALWFESPIFSTGVKSDLLLGRTVREAIDQGHLVVCDRSLSEMRFADPEIGAHERFFAIYAPHKVICVNGLKFGAVTFGACWYDAFDHWQDVLSGGISVSAELATRHYISPDFENYRAIVDHYTASASNVVGTITQPFVRPFEMDEDARGYWRTVYAPLLPSALGSDRDWLAGLVSQTGAVLIPGTLMGSNPDWGLCFRLNLLRYDPQWRGAFRRVLLALEEQIRARVPQ